MQRLDDDNDYKAKTLEDLRELINHDDERAKIELALRFNENLVNVRIKKKEVIEILTSELAKNPDHNLFNLLRAKCEKENLKLKEDCLLKAARLRKPGDKQYAAEAAYKLAYFYAKSQKNFLKAQAWLARANSLGHHRAAKDFLGFKGGKYRNTYENDALVDVLSGFLDNKETISSCAFLTVAFANTKFKNFANSAWCNYWGHPDSFIAANHDAEFPERNEFKYPNPIYTIAEQVLKNDEKTFYQYFSYCYEKNIIAEKTYLDLMNFMTAKAKSQSIKDLAHYALMRFYLHSNPSNQEKVVEHFSKLSDTFSGYQIADFKNLASEQQNLLSYQLFLKLSKVGRIKEALEFLANVTDPRVYDETIFQLFSKLAQNDIETIHLQQTIVSRAKNNPKLATRAEQADLISQIPGHIRIAFYSIIEQLKELSQTTKLKGKHVDLAFQKMQTEISQLQTAQDYLDCSSNFKIIIAKLHDGKKAPNTNKINDELDKIESLIKILPSASKLETKKFTTNANLLLILNKGGNQKKPKQEIRSKSEKTIPKVTDLPMIEFAEEISKKSSILDETKDLELPVVNYRRLSNSSS